MKLDKILSDMKDYHLPVSIFMFIIGTVMQWFHKLDMAYVAYAGTILGAITGHAFSPAQKAPDVVDTPAQKAPDPTDPNAAQNQGR
jgi:hypothetical protein